MKRSLLLATLFAMPVLAQVVPPFTADSYRLNPAKYLDTEITLAVAFVIPSQHTREDGLQELVAHTYNLNQIGGHISIMAKPDVAQRVATQCGTQRVFNRSRITFIRGMFKKDEAANRYYVFVPK